MIQIDMELPKCCDECFALDDHGDYPFCLISQDQRGYTFNVRENRMPSCPLKAQEPRVMTPEEVLSNIGTSAWLETWNGAIYTGWVLVYDRQTNGLSATIRLGITQPNGHVSWLKEIDYGRTWRLWTTEPTEEQRDATPWE